MDFEPKHKFTVRIKRYAMNSKFLLKSWNNSTRFRFCCIFFLYLIFFKSFLVKRHYEEVTWSRRVVFCRPLFDLLSFSFRHYIVYPSSIYCFLLSLWYFQTFLYIANIVLHGSTLCYTDRNVSRTKSASSFFKRFIEYNSI